MDGNRARIVVAMHEFAMVPGPPLANYSLGLRLRGARGDLVVAVECSSWLPEFSADVLAVACPLDELAGWMDWAAMPWLDALERALGCTYRVVEALLDQPPPFGSVAFGLRHSTGRLAHVAMAGVPLDALADALADASADARRVPARPWMRVSIHVLLRLSGATVAEMERLARGAVLRLDRDDVRFQFVNGSRKYEMSARWATENGLQGDASTLSPRSRSVDAPLRALEELTFDVDVVLESLTLSYDEAAGLCAGGVVNLKGSVAGRHVTLVSHGRPFAKGELVAVDGHLAVLVDECWGNRA
ncbi:FliM/FliN family flagellar motor switch protein [Luteibacter sp. CQ10]|uniref:FliM/FliN family flagellar motor switch protein n=1 Tax=Luteibacter sp. CQ10 TaxID=2805821 RepID=UPI0034A417AC